MTAPACEVTQQEDGVAVARLHGDIDVANVPVITTTLREEARAAGRGLVIDLSGVRYLDSAGMQLLFQLAQDLTVARKGLLVALPEDAPISRLLKITNFHESAGIHPTVADCVAALRSGAYPQY